MTRAMKLFLIGIALTIALVALRANASATQVNYQSREINTPTLVAFGPVGPNCDAASGGSGCTFYSFTGSGTGQLTLEKLHNSIAAGTYTDSFSGTVYFGALGVSADGEVDPTTGAAIGFCNPVFGTGTDTFPDGSALTWTGQGQGCPSTGNGVSTFTSGTGRFAGVSGTGNFSCYTPPSGSVQQCQGSGAFLLP